MPTGAAPGADDTGSGATIRGAATLMACIRRLPLVEPPHGRRLLGRVDQGPRAVGRDDLAAADLAVRVLLHAPSVGRSARRSWRYRFTSGSTSRRERLGRSFR